MLVALAALPAGAEIETSRSVETDPASPGASEEAKAVDFKNLKSPVAYTKKSIDFGKLLYIRMCAGCHGPDGKAITDVMGDATDLTDPEDWLSGTTPGEIFRSTRDGAGGSMPGYMFEVAKEEDLWHLVNFMLSLWPESKRPPLQEDKAIEADHGAEKNSTQNGGNGHEEDNQEH